MLDSLTRVSLFLFMSVFHYLRSCEKGLSRHKLRLSRQGVSTFLSTFCKITVQETEILKVFIAILQSFFFFIPHGGRLFNMTDTVQDIQ